MNIQEIRQQYPQYDDLTDEQLAQSLHQKFYGDMPYAQFAEQIGLAQQPSAGVMQRPMEFAQGFNVGLANTLGLPVDLMNWGLTKAGIGSEAPIAGSDWIQGLMRQAGMVGEPTDRTGRVLGRIGQELGATALPVGATLGAANTARRFASPLINEIMQSVRAAPGLYAGAETGLSVASGTGAAAAREIAPGNPWAEIAGQWLPLLAPTAAAGLARTVMRGGEPGRRALQQNLDTFARAGVEPTAGQATGRPSLQGTENVLARTPGGVSPMQRAAQRASDQLSSKIDDLTSGLSRTTETEAAGRAISRGVGDFANRFRAQSEKLFNRLDQFIPGNASVKVANSQNALETLTAPIQGAERISAVLANPKIAKIHEALMADAGTTGALPYRALKDIRSQVGRMLSSPDVIADVPKAQLKTLYGALTRDMETAAAAAGPGAERALSRANKYYRSGMERIDNVLESVVKRGKPEEVFQAAMRGASEGATTIRALRRSVPAEQWDVVAATVLQRMGLARKGMQNAAGDAFSIETYLTNWNKLKPEARSALFGGTRYAGLSKDLDAIAESASKIREASRILANPSGTAGQSAGIGTLLGAGSGMGAAMMAGRPDIAAKIPVTVGAVMGSANVGARLMTNQKFIRWLAESTRMPVERLPGHIARLSVTMRREDPETKEAVQTYLQQLGGGND